MIFTQQKFTHKSWGYLLKELHPPLGFPLLILLLVHNSFTNIVREIPLEIWEWYIKIHILAFIEYFLKLIYILSYQVSQILCLSPNLNSSAKLLHIYGILYY